MTELNKRAEAYMTSATESLPMMITRSELREHVMRAWIQGYAEGATAVNFLQCQNCPQTVKLTPPSVRVIFIDELTELRDGKSR